MVGMNRPTARLVGCLIFACAAFAAKASRAAHPPLVSVSASGCAECHGDALKGRGSQHAAAAADCTNCHTVTIDRGDTRIGLKKKGPGLCVDCHKALAKAAAGTLPAAHPPVSDDCGTCHKPHSSEEKKLLRAPIGTLCADCHDAAELQTRHGNQLTATTNCASCHAAHGGTNSKMLVASRQHAPFAKGACDSCHRPASGNQIRLRNRDAKLCTACHADVLKPAAPGETIHKALNLQAAGKPGCVACHNPHMGESTSLLVARGPALCAGCHAGIVSAAQAKTGHDPAAEDCLNCHQPHRSGQAHLLTEPAKALCANCHDTSDKALAAKHLGAPLGRLECTNCHTPHGSGNRKLLARTLHPPLEDGCDTCHEGSWDRKVENGGAALCLGCHDDIGKTAKNSKFPHAALEGNLCTECHNPHATAQPALLKKPRGGVCFECHDDKQAAAGEVEHGAITLVGCQACHAPHGGEREKLLTGETDRLCLACHDARAARERRVGDQETVKLLDRFVVPGAAARAISTLQLSPDGQNDHPVTGHRALGQPTPQELKATTTTHKTALSCITCHDPHKGRSRLLLRWNATSGLEACLKCHPK